jgi:hypothetical protein
MSTVTIAPTVESGTGAGDPPRVRLNVTDSGTPAITQVTVTRLNPDGRTVPVRTTDGNPLTLSTSGSNRVGLIYDYEPPYGSPVSYSTLENPTTVSAQVTVSEPRVWLIHPGVPALSMPVQVLGIGPRVRSVAAGAHWPMGREHPVVQTDGQRKAPAYTLRLRTDGDQERTAVEALCWDAGTLLLNVPVGKGWGVGAEYVAVGELTEAREVDYGSWPRRVWELPCQVVARPEGGTQAERTYTDVLAENASYGALRTRYATYFDLLAGS